MKFTSKQIKIFAAISIGSVILGGAYLATQVKKALAYSYEFSKFTIKKASMALVQYQLVYKLTNPSKIKYSINSIDTNVLIGDTLVTKLKSEVKTIVKANSVTDLVIPGELSPNELIRAIRAQNNKLLPLLNVANTMVTLEMVINIGFMANLINLKVPYTYKFPLKEFLPESIK